MLDVARKVSCEIAYSGVYRIRASQREWTANILFRRVGECVPVVKNVLIPGKELPKKDERFDPDINIYLLSCVVPPV